MAFRRKLKKEESKGAQVGLFQVILLKQNKKKIKNNKHYGKSCIRVQKSEFCSIFLSLLSLKLTVSIPMLA